jgi:purine-binding chemotaxis protein CheW
MIQPTPSSPVDIVQRAGRGDVALLVFLLGEDRFALMCDRVLEILPATAIQALPDAPATIEGIVNVRGSIVPVLDIRRRFARAPCALHHDQHFILANTCLGAVAIRVDRALDVVTVPRSTIHPGSGASGTDQVAGVAVTADGLLVIQDLDRFLALDEAVEVDAALAAAANSTA